MPLIRIRDVGQESSDTFFDGAYEDAHLVKGGDLLVGMDGDFRLARWRGGRALLNQRVCKLVVESDVLRERFVEFVLPGYLEAIWQETSSVTVKHLSSKSVQEIPLPVPSLEEQDEIVRILEEQFSRLDAAAAAIATVRTKADQFRRSLLHAAFTGALTQHGARRVTAEKSGMSVLRPISSIADVTSGYWGQVDSEGDASVLVQVLRNGDIAGNSLRGTSAIRYFSQREADKARVSVGDIVLTSSGECGKVAYVGVDGLYVSNFVRRLRVTDPQVEPRWLYYTLQSPHTKQVLKKFTKGTTIANLQRAFFSHEFILVPSLDEQREIVRALDEQLSRNEAILATADEVERKVNAPRRSLLHAAFSGELTKEWRDRNNG